ncbi:hypothetical protein [Aneurinibacillus danicus]|jgi:uncharacterized membrane protein|uniref:Uncharacterized protein n=1 Tax=Aneurinibacillus danicus TaxID=267746 RepID=A0A511V435_9BACL|nr:hypothetical protein [Aneurinibacillus danicus]GEN32698.1 hypothetical protein ADA01nite_01580 [Aneurinibacillus danicus]
MINIGLLLLGFIQLFTAIITFMNKSSLFGIAPLPKELSHYRYMLTSLWISVGIIFIMGSWNSVIAPGAALLAVINVILEVVFYWKSDFPKWYTILGTIVMGGLGIWSSFSISF